MTSRPTRARPQKRKRSPSLLEDSDKEESDKEELDNAEPVNLPPTVSSLPRDVKNRQSRQVSKMSSAPLVKSARPYQSCRMLDRRSTTSESKENQAQSDKNCPAPQAAKISSVPPPVKRATATPRLPRQPRRYRLRHRRSTTPESGENQAQPSMVCSISATQVTRKSKGEELVVVDSDSHRSEPSEEPLSAKPSKNARKLSNTSDASVDLFADLPAHGE